MYFKNLFHYFTGQRMETQWKTSREDSALKYKLLYNFTAWYNNILYLFCLFCVLFDLVLFFVLFDKPRAYRSEVA